MEFGNPSSLLWGLLAIPIVIFYVLKVRLRRAPVSTVMFWDQVFEEKRPRAIWQRLRHLVSLLVQLAFLGLLVAALLDPSFSWERLRARRIVLIIDHSASMNATDVAPARLARAKQEARRVIRGLRARDEMAIVAAGSLPRVECGLTSHARTLRRALDRVLPTDAPDGMPAAVELGRRLLAGHRNGTLIVTSDGCFPQAEALAKAEDVTLVTVGGAAENAGITQFQVRRSLLDPIGYQVLVEVTNFGKQPVNCRLEIDLNDEVVDVLPLDLKSGDKWSKVIDQTAAQGGRLIARLDCRDALATDNRAVALLPERSRQPVLLITEGNLFLERVFEAIPIVDLAVSETIPARIPPGGVVVFHRTLPQELPPGNVLVIEPLAGCDLWNLGEPLENPIVTDQDADSPLMAHVRLDNVLMPEARKLDFNGEHQVLASSVDGEPIYCSIERPAGKVLVLTASLAKSDLPLRTAFPIMMTNALRWFQGSQGELLEAIAAGSVVHVDLEPLLSADGSGSGGRGATPLVLRDPDGKTRPLPAGVAGTTIGPLDQCGVWSIERQGVQKQVTPDEGAGAKLQLACNLISASEGNLCASLERRDLGEGDVSDFAGWPLWLDLVAVALVLTGLEWFLYQRRWIS